MWIGHSICPRPLYLDLMYKWGSRSCRPIYVIFSSYTKKLKYEIWCDADVPYAQDPSIWIWYMRTVPYFEVRIKCLRISRWSNNSKEHRVLDDYFYVLYTYEETYIPYMRRVLDDYFYVSYTYWGNLYTVYKEGIKMQKE